MTFSAASEIGHTYRESPKSIGHRHHPINRFVWRGYRFIPNSCGIRFGVCRPNQEIAKYICTVNRIWWYIWKIREIAHTAYRICL